MGEMETWAHLGARGRCRPSSEGRGRGFCRWGVSRLPPLIRGAVRGQAGQEALLLAFPTAVETEVRGTNGQKGDWVQDDLGSFPALTEQSHR